MAGFRKSREKAQAKRTEIQQKAKMTREELGGQLLKGIRAEQLDTVPEDALTPKNRISRLSTLGAQKREMELGKVKESDTVGQRPPRWENLLSADFTVEQWKNVQVEVESLVPEQICEPGALFSMKKKAIEMEFSHRAYEDEETMKLIFEAYKMGVADAKKNMTDCTHGSFMERIKDIIETQRLIINFLITDNEEKASPVLYLTPRELVERITLYFIECDLVKKFYTVPGLAFYIGFASREDFMEYIESNPESIHVYIIKRALTYIESERVADMLYGGGLMAGHKLDLATNFNYNDAGKKNENTPSQTNITVNNNTLSMNSAPPKAESIEEWQAWYKQEQAARKKAIEENDNPDAIDVNPVS